MALPALATTDDLEARLGRELTAEEAGRAEAILADASAAVRSYTRQEFTSRESTVRLLPRDGRLLLPQRPVTAIDSVEDIDANAVSFEWDGLDEIRIRGFVGDGFEVDLLDPYRARPIDVTYTHGFAEVPDDIVSVVCSVALRALSRAGEDSGFTGERLGNYSYTLASPAGVSAILEDERSILNGYRRPGRPVRMA